MQVRKRNGYPIKNDIEMANEFNKAFQSVFVQEDTTNLSDFSLDRDAPIIEDLVVTESMVDNLLKCKNVNKAMGPDDIHPMLLRECHSELASQLCLLFRNH